MQYGKNTSISRVITRATQIANAARRYFALTALAAALSACNQNDDDPTAQPDSAKPVIVVANPSLINGLILEATQPQSLIISPAGRINATDNNGTAILSVRNVVGLSAEQVQLATDGTLSAINILPTQAIGRGYVVVRANDTSGNFTDSTVYFDISPSLNSTQVTITPTQSHTFKFAVMPNITSASVTVPTNVMGVSGQAYLAGNEVVITLNTNSSTVAGEFKPQVSLMTAEGKAYPLVLTVMVKVDAPTTYAEPLLSVNQDTNTVAINNMGDLVKDLDGVKDVTVYLEANGVRIGNSQGLYANVLTSTSADVAYTISADYLTKNGVTGEWESGTHTFTTKAVLDKEVPADTTPPSKVSEDLPKIDFPAETNGGTITLSEDASRVV